VVQIARDLFLSHGRRLGERKNEGGIGGWEEGGWGRGIGRRRAG